MIKPEEIIMGRDKEFPLDLPLLNNLASLLAGINYLRGRYGRPLTVTSGFRPGHFNKGATLSAHLTLEAVDLADANGDFAKWCLENLKELETAGLYMEDPTFTRRWVHLQTRKPKTGNRVFKP
jgi:hypothetical protein